MALNCYSVRVISIAFEGICNGRIPHNSIKFPLIFLTVFKGHLTEMYADVHVAACVICFNLKSDMTIFRKS